MRRCLPLLLLLAGCFTDSEPESSSSNDGASSSSSTTTTTTSTTTATVTSGDPATTGPDTTSTSDSDGPGTDTGTPACPGRIEFIFDAASQSAGLDEFVFPVQFDSDDMEFYELSRLDGTDVWFVDGQDNPLPFEIDVFRPAGNSLFWVRMPRVDSENNRVSVCYGSGMDASSPANVWESGYLAVWHFNGDPGTQQTQVDSTGLGNDALFLDQPGEPPERMDSPLGYGVRFLGGAYYSATAATSYELDDAITVEVIAQAGEVLSGYVRPFNGASFEMLLADGVMPEPEFELLVEPDTSIASRPAVASDADTWMYLTGVYDAAAGSLEACLDATICDPRTIMSPAPAIRTVPASAELRLGDFEGVIDEVRVSNVARPPAWIQASHRGLRGTLLTPLR